MRNYNPGAHLVILFNVLFIGAVAGSRGVTVTGVLMVVAALLAKPKGGAQTTSSRNPK